MNVRWIMFFFGTFFILTVINVVIEGSGTIAATNTANATDISTFAVIQDPSILWTTNSSWATTLSVPQGFLSAPINFIQKIYDVLSFNYSYFTGIFFLVRVFLWSFSIGALWGLVQLIRGTSS